MNIVKALLRVMTKIPISRGNLLKNRKINSSNEAAVLSCYVNRNKWEWTLRA